MGKHKLLTEDRQVFLDEEYKLIFFKVFKTQETFEKEMQAYLRQCDHCKSIHWLSEERRCDCDYILQNDNHGNK